MAKILVVEDDPFLRNLLVKKLTDAQYEIVVAVTGEEALEKIDSSLDLILLDIILPGINGFEILRRIKEDDQLSSIPVVVLTNLGGQEDVQKAHDLGAEDFWIKAYLTPDEILDKIKKILANKNG